jgi:hypothetical protein
MSSRPRRLQRGVAFAVETAGRGPGRAGQDRAAARVSRRRPPAPGPAVSGTAAPPRSARRVEVDHEPAGRDQCLLLQAPPLLPGCIPFDRVAVTDDITALEDVVPGVAQVGGKARQFQVVAMALKIGQPKHLQAQSVHDHVLVAAFHPEQPHVQQPHQASCSGGAPPRARIVAPGARRSGQAKYPAGTLRPLVTPGQGQTPRRGTGVPWGALPAWSPAAGQTRRRR